MSSRLAIAALAAMCALGTACSSDESGDTETTPAESVSDTEFTPATTSEPTSVPAAGDDLSAATCATLLELHEFNDDFNAAAASGDLARVKTFDSERTPQALELYDVLSGAVPGSETDLEQARQLTAELSAVIADAATFEDVTSGMFAIPDLGAANASVIAIDQLAVERCVAD